jgi:predicted AlkP superfamily pyrophosphatase or phosphodiesterase
LNFNESSTLKRSIFTVLLLLVIVGCRSAAPGGEATASSDRSVVMISVDGLAGYYLDDPKAQMPNIRKLAAEGARAASMKAVVPTVTWPNHVTLVTGVTPAKHGVTGNNYFDRATQKSVVLIGDPTFDKGEIVKVPTVYDLAQRAGLRTAAMQRPATRNDKGLDWNMPELKVYAALERYTEPTVIAEMKSWGLWPKTDSPDGHAYFSDESATKAFIKLLQTHRPNLALLHLIDVDHTEHTKGPRTEAAYTAVQAADKLVGEVWDELQRDFAGRATLLVVSDHGFSPVEHVLLPNVVLQKSGLIEVNGPRVTGGSVRVVPQGGCAFVYILDQKNRNSIVDRIYKAFDHENGIDKVVSSESFAPYGVADPKADPHAPDVLLFAKEGWSFGDTAAGALPVIEKTEPSGTHGHDPNIPDLHATFVAWGAGIKPGTKLGEIANTDVAPTIAALLGLQMRGTDGHALTAALAR